MTPKYFKFCSFSVKYKRVFEKSKFILSWAIREFRTLDFSLVHLRVRSAEVELACVVAIAQRGVSHIIFADSVVWLMLGFVPQPNLQITTNYNVDTLRSKDTQIL
jgi:hypothetical protein